MAKQCSRDDLLNACTALCPPGRSAPLARRCLFTPELIRSPKDWLLQVDGSA